MISDDVKDLCDNASEEDFSYFLFRDLQKEDGRSIIYAKEAKRIILNASLKQKLFRRYEEALVSFCFK